MSVRRTLSLLAVCAAAALAPRARAATNERPPILINAPNFRPLPIAVQAFASAPDAKAAAAEATAVVRADLSLSGLFDVLDPKGYLADPKEGLAVAQVAFTRWADVGADGLVKAAVRSEGGELVGELHVYEVRAAREGLSKSFRVPAGQARALGHRMSDEIVRYYTHEPGVFATRIAAIRKANDQFQLVLVDVDGKNAEVLLTEKDILQFPAWKPDGTEILLTSYRTGHPELWVYRLADRTFRSLAHRADSFGGVYSPDGRRVAYCQIEGGNTHIWVMNADGSSPKRLTRQSTSDSKPTWSPDGSRIAFSSDLAGTPQLYVMSAADGSGAKRLTFQGNYNQTPAWSPRGDAIAFTARDERKMFDVFWISPDTGVISRVTQDQGIFNESPSYAPNGRLLVFRTDRNGFGQLVISDPKGDRQTVILGSAGADLVEPAWGPAK